MTDTDNSDTNDPNDTIETIEQKIKEFKNAEKYFDVDDKGKLIYDVVKDQEYALNNLTKKKTISGYKSLIKWLDGKNKNELVKDLNKAKDKKAKEKAKSIKPSSEQTSIIESISRGKNVVVDAVAGSGKTTTVLFVAKENPDKKILQITYNKQLKLEVRQKVLNSNIENLEIHTYHSMAVKFYDDKAHTDDGITNIIKKNIRPRTKRQYDILIIDEVQDMTPNYFRLVCKFISDMDLKPTMLILGDRKQGIYEFKNADTRFLSFSKSIWNNNDNFIDLPLQQSYRVTEQIAWFVNNVMIGQNRIISTKKGTHPVYYFRKKLFFAHSIFAKKIVEFLNQGYNPSDIFVISPSVKSNSNRSPIKKLENSLVSSGIPVYFSRSDEDGIDEEIIKGKVVFTTFHQSKGRERKIVFLFGFENSYFDYHAKEKDRTVCPSELYVAATRASEILLIIENECDVPLPFLKYTHSDMKSSSSIFFSGSVYESKEKEKKEKVLDDIHRVSATELTKYINETNTDKLSLLINKIITITTKPKSEYTVEIPSNVKMANGLTEDVSDLNGLIIPAMYERKKTSKESTLEYMFGILYQMASKNTQQLITKKFEETQKTTAGSGIAKFLFTGNAFIALSENIHSKLNQITNYDWLNSDIIKCCHKNLSAKINDNAVYEAEIGDKEDIKGKYYTYTTNSYGTIEIRGRIDVYDESTVWELKCVNSLQLEHLLQLVIYAWVWEKSMKEKYGKKSYKILNVRTRETRTLEYDNSIVDEIMSILFENKYSKQIKDTDINFIKKCKEARENSDSKKIEKYFNSDNSDSDSDSDSNSDNDNIPIHNMFSKVKSK